MQVPMFLLIGVLAGILGRTLWGWWGAIIVPALIFLAGDTQVEATPLPLWPSSLVWA
jgi:uncharacterized membrane protein YfcA